MTFAARGYERLNRDERGGSLAALTEHLDERLAAGARHVVLDNTWLTRAARSRAVEVASRHGVAVRCVWLDTPLAQAQVNLVARLLDAGPLRMPEDLRRGGRAPGVLGPGSQMRAARELEPAVAEEGFAAVERTPFTRGPELANGRGVLVAAAALERAGWRAALAGGERGAPHLVFDWSPDRERLAGRVAEVAAAVGTPVEGAHCPHGGGPPRCWCRPPLPGLPLAFARAHGIDPARCLLVGAGPAHRALARALGARYVECAP